jgi:ABC-type sugar transport system ATPase subunit
MIKPNLLSTDEQIGGGLSPMTDNKTPIVRLEGISKQFPGVQALDRVELTVFPGEIHAVVGENGAGKTTLMNILAGEVQPDDGRIVYQNEEREIPNPYISQQIGISVVYQETALCPNLNVAENISLIAAGTRFPLSLLNRNEFVGGARESLAKLGMEEVDLNRQVGRLSVAQQQMVEIAKAISTRANVLILDEPNSALTQEETDHLFSVLRQLRSDGVAILYVSHRLEEVMSLADRITILRDGKLIDTLDASKATIDGVISKMVGKVVDMLYQRKTERTVGERIVLEIRDLTCGNEVKNISMKVYSGEVLGIAGLPDSGKDELVECCFGLRPYTGTIQIDGMSVAIHSPSAAIGQGMAFVPADRRGSGALLVLNVQDNVITASLKAVSNVGFLRRPLIRKITQHYVNQLDIRITSLTQQMATLSGGNQQKVILARGLATKPSVLLMHEPTRGIDVGAKEEIYSILQELASEGVAIVIVSSELPELIGQCDRIAVMHEGRITGQFARDEAEEEAILACAMGHTIQLH